MEMVVTMDKFGRVLLPKKIRQEVKTHTFILQSTGKVITLKAVPKLEDCIGMFPEINMAAFKKQHEEDKGKDG